MKDISQTQLSNVMAVAGLIVIIANQLGFVLDQSATAFIIASAWTLGWNAYNYYQRFQKGDLTLGGSRK